MKIGYVGSGSIMQYHILASGIAGFQPTAICARQNSKTALDLSLKYKDLMYCADILTFLEKDLDAITIAVSVESCIDVLKQCMERNIPILVEKPVSLNSLSLDIFDSKDTSKIIVGYNRRHYSSVSAFKSKLSKMQGGLVQVSVPELSWDKDSSSELRQNMLYENVVHVLDLANYLFGPIEITNKVKTNDLKGLVYSSSNFIAPRGFVGSISLGFGTPENISIKVWGNGQCIELNPLEEFRESKSIQMIPATSDNPVKKYVKTFSSDWKISEDDLVTKPGFLGQYKELYKIANKIKFESKSANLKDARVALDLAKIIS